MSFGMNHEKGMILRLHIKLNLKIYLPTCSLSTNVLIYLPTYLST